MIQPARDPRIVSLMQEGLARLQAGQWTEAETIFGRILRTDPINPAAEYRLGVALAKQGKLAQSCSCLREALLKGSAGPEEWKFALDVLHSAGDFESLAELYRRLLALQPQNAAAHYSFGNVLRSLGRMDAAEAAWLKAVALKPDFGHAHNNLGTLAKMRGNLAGAASSFSAAITASPDFGAAYHNLGTVLEEMGDLAGAERAYRKALTVEPNHPDTRRYLGGVLCEQGKTQEAFETFMDHAQRRYSISSNPGAEGPLKVRHDNEQRDWLGEPNRDLSILFIRGGERLSGALINRQNAGYVTESWQRANPKIVVIDDFLKANALAAIREYCLGSTIWRQVFPTGYLGSLPEHGFAVPLLAQLAEELADAYPAIFASHPLLQLWAFKYCGGPMGIKLHADFAAVNVNFWITPDQANRDASSGGLMIWDKAAPADWDFKTFNNDESAIRAFLSQSGAQSITVPYRANRAIIFDSDLFHETDALNFHEGYINHRINITFLYGWREGARKMIS